jgi:phage shock protein C
MNQNLVTLQPLIMISVICIIVAVIISKLSSKQKGNSYQPSKEFRMLCKSQSNRVIAGVCGGIAEYFGWNATVVRLFFLFSGVGLLTYIILTIVIPDSPSSLL